MTFKYYVQDAAGEIVTSYDRKAEAVAHAERIGGKWFKARY